ncbi:MAG: hypothetical protein WEB13_07290 [Dehalococcoidia bacterium]|jgi:hypothetical protein
MPQPQDVRAAVRAMVEAAGLPVSEDEFEKFVEMYPTLRAGADSLYIEEVRYEEPALVFSPLAPAPRA